MARLQILELPEGSSDDRPPFVLVVDECIPQRVALDADAPYRDYWQDIAQRIGARGVIVASETIDIPGNDVPLDPDGHPIKFRIEPDFETFREQVQDEIRKTQGELARAINRDGIDPKLADLVLKTLGIELVPGGVPLDEVLYNACRELEKSEDARKRVRRACKNSLTDALGMDQLRDWDDIRNAAAGIRKQRDEQGEAIERVRQLHQPVDYRGAVICRECSAYAEGSADNAPVAHDKCGTLQALTGRQPTMICDIIVDNAAEVVASHDPSRRA